MRVSRILLALIVVSAAAPLPAAAPTLPVIGAAAPDFALPAVRGGNLRLSEYRGQVVVLSFWSSRCSSCAAQLAALSALQETYGSAGLVTLAVSIDSDLVRARAFAEALAASQRANLPMLLDVTRAVGRQYGVDRLPTTVLIDRAGRVRLLIRDFHRTDNSYISQVRALLDDSASAQWIAYDAGLHS